MNGALKRLVRMLKLLPPMFSATLRRRPSFRVPTGMPMRGSVGSLTHTSGCPTWLAHGGRRVGRARWELGDGYVGESRPKECGPGNKAQRRAHVGMMPASNSAVVSRDSEAVEPRRR